MAGSIPAERSIFSTQTWLRQDLGYDQGIPLDPIMFRRNMRVPPARLEPASDHSKSRASESDTGGLTLTVS
ncbi:MAG: hypothetical protein RL518_924 [Pseudomonadota bacterium]|jgi:hypothetical protein